MLIAALKQYLCLCMRKQNFAIQVGLYSESQDSVFLALAESVS